MSGVTAPAHRYRPPSSESADGAGRSSVSGSRPRAGRLCLQWRMADHPSTDLLIKDTRIVPFRSRTELGALRRGDPRPGALAAPPPGEPVDVRIKAGRVVEVGQGLSAPGTRVLDAEGSFLIPGLWDAHAHLDMEAARSARIDTLATRSARPRR